MRAVTTAGGAGLVGREAELDTLLHALGSHSLVTVSGLPGVGRSALSAAAAARLAANGTAVVTVSLAASEDPLAVVDAVIAELPCPGLSTSLPEAMWEAYDGIAVLLVLEDVDRVQGLATVVETLAEGYPQALVLCTAARSTGLPGEHVLRLSPLPVPDPDASADHPCLVLFATLASRRGAHVDLIDDRQRADAASVCRLAGGLPGAMELAAARLTLVPLAVMAHGFGEGHGARPALTWSFDLLSKPAQSTLLQLSAFEGPFLLDAVAAVVDLGPTSADPFDVLLELVDTHLLDLDPAHSGEPRFLVPAPVRDFARSMLLADPIADEVRVRHARYFGQRGMAGTEVVRREWPDMVAALDHQMATGLLDDALAAAVALAPEVQEVPGAVASLEKRITELLDKGEQVPARLRAQALIWSTGGYTEQTAHDMQCLGLWTAQHLAEATRLARESGDGPALLDALERTVRQLRITLDLRAAVSAAHEGLDLAQRLDDQRATARFECYVGMAAWSTGDADAAVHLATASITRGREHGDPYAVTAAAQLLHALPEELRLALDPPLPSLPELAGPVRAALLAALHGHGGSGAARAREPRPWRCGDSSHVGVAAPDDRREPPAHGADGDCSAPWRAAALRSARVG